MRGICCGASPVQSVPYTRRGHSNSGSLDRLYHIVCVRKLVIV